jgi:hypothetical protein
MSTTTSNTIPPSGNGTTKELAAWSNAVSMNPSTFPQYVVDNLGTTPRFQRIDLAEALYFRNTSHMIRIFDGATLQLVGQLPAGNQANPAVPSGASGVAAQHQTVSNAHATLNDGTPAPVASAPSGGSASGQ